MNVHICDPVKAAAVARVRKTCPALRPAEPKVTADAVLPKPTRSFMIDTTEKVVVVGSLGKHREIEVLRSCG